MREREIPGWEARAISVLLITGDEDDYTITRDMLTAQQRFLCTLEWLPDYDSALPAISEARHDVYIIDYRLGERTGLELIDEAIGTPPHAPVIMLTGESDHRIDLEASARGVTDYLIKQELDAVAPGRSIRYAISHHRTVGELARSEELRRAAEQQLEHGARYDRLTGLPNRALFMDRVGRALRRQSRKAGATAAILFVDVDSFKLVNDSLGHEAGDDLLVALAARLSDALPSGETVARIGGDEFALLLEGVRGESEAIALARRLQQLLSEPFQLGDRELFVSASIGIAYGSRSLRADELLRNADIAMFDAKRRGRGRRAVFDQSMHRRVVDRLIRENELRQAIEQSLLEVHYQPIVDLSTGRIRALEALARWPVAWGDVAPPEFILIAEETGMIGALGMHVLRRALTDLVSWREHGLVGSDVWVSVNISSRQFEDPGLFQEIRETLASTGLPAGALRLEITESALMQDPERTAALLAEICATGVGLHLDDFGTGYSSLATLNQFPFDALKIDRSFIASIMHGDAGNGVLVRSTVALAHSLGLNVIAEGIEAPEQLERLRGLGCEYGQGFLFSRAVSPERMEQLLPSWPPARTSLVPQPA